MCSQRMCAASWKKVNQKWSFFLYRRLICIHGVSLIQYAAPHMPDFGISRTNSSSTPASRQSARIISPKSSCGATVNLRMDFNTSLNFSFEYGGSIETIGLADICPALIQALVFPIFAVDAPVILHAAGSSLQYRVFQLLISTHPKKESRLLAFAPASVPAAVSLT